MKPEKCQRNYKYVNSLPSLFWIQFIDQNLYFKEVAIHEKHFFSLKMGAWLQILQVMGNSTLFYLLFDTHDIPGSIVIWKSNLLLKDLEFWEKFESNLFVCTSSDVIKRFREFWQNIPRNINYQNGFCFYNFSLILALFHKINNYSCSLSSAALLCSNLKSWQFFVNL